MSRNFHTVCHIALRGTRFQPARVNELRPLPCDCCNAPPHGPARLRAWLGRCLRTPPALFGRRTGQQRHSTATQPTARPRSQRHSTSVRVRVATVAFVDATPTIRSTTIQPLNAAHLRPRLLLLHHLHTLHTELRPRFPSCYLQTPLLSSACHGCRRCTGSDGVDPPQRPTRARGLWSSLASPRLVWHVTHGTDGWPSHLPARLPACRFRQTPTSCCWCG